MNTDSIIIRPMRLNEVDFVANLIVLAFAENEEEIVSRLLDNPRFEPSDILVADYHGELVGTTTVIPTEMWLGGAPVKVGAIAWVTVLSEYRNKGIASDLMEAAIAKMFKDDQTLTLLFPFSYRYYNKFGYGTVGDSHAYRFSPENIAVTGNASKVRPFLPDDLPMLRELYKEQMPRHNGWLTRNNAWWGKLLHKWSKIVVFDDGGMIDGYCIYETVNGENSKSILEIQEFFADKTSAYQGLLAFLAAQNDIDVIEYMAPPDTLLRHSFRQPIAEGGQSRGWIFNDLCHITPGPMVRIINLTAALTSRYYTQSLSGECVFKVTDPLILENEKPVLFRLVDGRAETQPAGDSPIQVETDINTLSQILCGYLSATDARRLGRLKADEDTCSWLDKIITGRPLHMQSGDWF